MTNRGTRLVSARILKKICVLGDFAVGKTSMIRRYVLDEFDDRYITTLGTKITKKTISLDGRELTFQIWDIVGNIKFTKIQGQYYQGSDGAFIIFDVTRRDTFDNVSKWANNFLEVAKGAKLIFIANKVDLESIFDYETMMADLAKTYDAVSFRTSAKTGAHVEDAFQSLGKMIITGKEKKS
jgi:small GTP-binding protein